MDLAQVTLAQMRYAAAVDESRSFRQAAQRCHVSQSGLSMQIQKLEQLLGLALFDRSKKPIMVTPEGERALLQMKLILRETQRLGQVVAQDEEPAGRFRLGVIPTLSPTVLPRCLGEFVRQYPRVELAIEELETEAIIARLRADTLDAGLAATPLAIVGLHERELGRETLLAYLPPGDPLARKKSVHQRDLEARQLWVMPEGHCFRSQVLSFCKTSTGARSGPIHFESGSFETLIRLVDDGLGATILPALTAANLAPERREAQLRPFTAPQPVRAIGLVTARTDLRRKVCDALVAVFGTILRTELGSSPPRARVLDPQAR